MPEALFAESYGRATRGAHSFVILKLRGHKGLGAIRHRELLRAHIDLCRRYARGKEKRKREEGKEEGKR